MKYAWMSALALCAFVGLAGTGPIEAAGSYKTPPPDKEKPTEAPKETPKGSGESKEDVKKFDSFKELQAQAQADGKALGRSPTAEQRKEYFHNCLAMCKQYIADHPDAEDLGALYDWVQSAAQYFSGDDLFFEIADGYLANHKDLSDGGAYQWKKIVLLAELKNDSKKKDAEAELKKIEADGAKNAACAVLAADIKVSQALEKKDNKAAADVVATLKKNKVVAASKDVWTARDYQRLVMSVSTATLKDGETFPDWSEAGTVLDLDGKEINLTQYKGKVVLIDFWATWCGPCMGEMPNVIKLYNELHDKGFEVIGMSFDNRGGEQTLRDTIAGKGKVEEMPWRQIFDGGGWASGMARRYSVTSIPKSVLIGRDGKIISIKGDNGKDMRGEALAEKVRDVVGDGK